MPGVVMVSIPVTDQDKAALFYTEHLGFRVVADSAMGPTMRWVQLAGRRTDEPDAHHVVRHL